MKLYTSIFLLVLLACNVKAQNGFNLYGQVIDSKSKEGVDSAVVTLTGSSEGEDAIIGSDNTDNDGNYSISFGRRFSNREVTIEVKKKGYKDFFRRFSLMSSSVTDIKLTKGMNPEELESRIKEQATKIKEQATKIKEQATKFKKLTSQRDEIAEKNVIISKQNVIISKQIVIIAKQIAQQNKDIKEQAKIIKEQAKIIKEQEAIVKEQDAIIRNQGEKIKDNEKLLKFVDKIIVEKLDVDLITFGESESIDSFSIEVLIKVTLKDKGLLKEIINFNNFELCLRFWNNTKTKPLRKKDESKIEYCFNLTAIDSILHLKPAIEYFPDSTFSRNDKIYAALYFVQPDNVDSETEDHAYVLKSILNKIVKIKSKESK